MLCTGIFYILTVVSGWWLEQGKFCAKLGEFLQMLTEMFGTFAMKSQNVQSKKHS
jgi:hypothetical protein